MKTKFIILLSLVLFSTMGIWGQSNNSADDKVSSQNRKIEEEKRIRELFNKNQYVYVAKVTRRVLAGYLIDLPNRLGRSNSTPIFSNRMLIEKNLKGATEKLINLEDDGRFLKKGVKYLIFARTTDSFSLAINLAVSKTELEIVERILAENK